MSGKEMQVSAPSATIGARAPDDAPEGSLYYSTASCRLYAREGGAWQVIGQVIPLEAPENMSRATPLSRLQGHPR